MTKHSVPFHRSIPIMCDWLWKNCPHYSDVSHLSPPQNHSINLLWKKSSGNKDRGPEINLGSDDALHESLWLECGETAVAHLQAQRLHNFGWGGSGSQIEAACTLPRFISHRHPTGRSHVPGWLFDLYGALQLESPSTWWRCCAKLCHIVLKFDNIATGACKFCTGLYYYSQGFQMLHLWAAIQDLLVPLLQILQEQSDIHHDHSPLSLQIKTQKTS